MLTEAVKQYAVGPNDDTLCPLCLSKPSQSRIYSTSYAAFTKLPGSEVQKIFSQKHFLLSDAPGPLHNFDLEGMQCIADVFWKMEVQGGLLFPYVSIKVSELNPCRPIHPHPQQ